MDLSSFLSFALRAPLVDLAFFPILYLKSLLQCICVNYVFYYRGLILIRYQSKLHKYFQKDDFGSPAVENFTISGGVWLEWLFSMPYER